MKVKKTKRENKLNKVNEPNKVDKTNKVNKSNRICIKNIAAFIKKRKIWRISLYVKLLVLLLAAGIASTGVFVGLNDAADYYMQSNNLYEAYIEKQNNKYIDKFQEYVSNQKLSIRDIASILKWVKKQGVISIRLYENDILIFDSEYENVQEIWLENIERDQYDWNFYYEIKFSDAQGEVSINGTYEYQLSNYIRIGTLIISFVFFVIVVLLGIRNKMKYIGKLCDEIGILEGGNLEYTITVKGNDELGELARGLDSMRESFRVQAERETQMTQENQRIITEMSHDIRTPITSIMLYTEILKKGAYKDMVQLPEYLDKIDQKAKKMKLLTENLFQYTLVSGGGEVKLEPEESFKVLFYDLLSETCSYLSQNGFDTDVKEEWPQCKIKVNSDYIARIIDNITSNIIKYADPTDLIKISMEDRKTAAAIRFENKILQNPDKTDSTGIGTQSIRSMMKKMGGSCEISEDGTIYQITIAFPICSQ